MSRVPALTALLPLGLLAACATMGDDGLELTDSDGLHARIETSGRYGEVVVASVAPLRSGAPMPKLLEVTPFADRDGDRRLDPGEELAEATSVGDGKSGSQELVTAPVELPRVVEGGALCLAVAAVSEGTEVTWILERSGADSWLLVRSDESRLGRR